MEANVNITRHGRQSAHTHTGSPEWPADLRVSVTASVSAEKDGMRRVIWLSPSGHGILPP